MIYKNFDDHITRKHGIVIEGWPLRKFENPSSVGSQIELKTLLNAWQTGATRFRKMTVADHLAWVENRPESEHTSTAAHSSHMPPLLSPPPTQHSQGPAPAVNSLAPSTEFNVVHFDSSTTPLVRTDSPGSVAKKPRKTRSDKGKPRKRSSQVPGAGVFHADML